MGLPFQKLREIIFLLLFSQDFAPCEESDMIPFLMNELKVTRRSMAEACGKMSCVLEKKEEIDRLIEAASTEYAFDRISRVEKSILRLALFEILFDDKIPPKVAIAEAVRLCRKFATPESSQFVNAILDGVYKKSGAYSTSAEEPVSL